VAAMPVLLRWLAVVHSIAMVPTTASQRRSTGIAVLWVGGHILLVGADTLGWHWPYGVVHHAEEAVAAGAPFAAGALAWLTNTLGSAIAGVLVGAVLVALAHLLPRRGHRAPGVTQGAEDH